MSNEQKQRHRGSYFEDTEVLTTQGFVHWATVFADGETPNKHNLAAIDVASGEIHFEYPKKLFAYEINDEPLYEVKGRYINQLVTADHRMPISTRSYKRWTDWRFEAAINVEGVSVRHRLNGNIAERCTQHSPLADVPVNWIKLAGFYFKNGTTLTAMHPRRVSFQLKKTVKIDWLYGLGFPVVKGGSNSYVVHHAELALWLKENWHDQSGKKKISNWLIRSSNEVFHGFVEGLKPYSGMTKHPRNPSLDTTNKEALDILQAAAAAHGLHGNMTLISPSQGEGYQDCWRIHFNPKRHFCRVETSAKARKQNITERWVKKTGKVYCAAVSTGALIIRREGVVSVSGDVSSQASR